MIIAGIAVSLLGFVLAFLSLGVTDSTGVRLGMVLAGLAISLTGILGVLNRAYLKNAIWRR